jgi:hypothetical protein
VLSPEERQMPQKIVHAARHQPAWNLTAKRRQTSRQAEAPTQKRCAGEQKHCNLELRGKKISLKKANATLIRSLSLSEWPCRHFSF